MAENVSLLKIPFKKLTHFPKADIIFKEGSFGFSMYFIYSGKVKLYTEAPGRQITLAIVGPGEFFGEMALIDSSPRTATAVAEEDTKLVAVDKAKFLELLNSHPEFAFTIIQNLSKILRERWNLFNELKKGDQKGGSLELVLKSTNLDEINTSLNFLQSQMKKEKVDSETRMLNNVRELVLPYIDKLKLTRLNAQQREYVSIIENNLENIMSPFLGNLPSEYSRLTPNEMKIANLIKDGKTSKEISSVLNLSTTTIDFHRNNIRSKLNLKNKDVGLRAYLMTLSKSE